ncbi:GNAT family N-acetyltransferase [Streptomyces sp. NPDC051907]|uniref:GNAT family N-acetyltransferase n=1 Tax=Streptomyces sp. NPDC051907 TaxID=3155284 RepID=UPI00341D6218
MSTPALRLPPRYRARSLTADDADAWHELMEESEKTDGASANYYPEEFLEAALDGRLDPVSDSVGVFADGVLAGFAVVHAKLAPNGAHRVILEGGVAPGHRRQGIGTQLMRWSCGRARERQAALSSGRRSSAAVWSLEENTDLRSLAEAHGFQATRWWYEVSCQLDEVAALEIPELPSGFALRTVRPADMAGLREVHNASFNGQWEDGAVSPERWKQDFENDPLFQPGLSYLVLDPAGAIVSYVLTQTNEWQSEGATQRELRINYLGTPPGWRGRGFFRHLTAAVDQAARREGYDHLGFTVDSGNPTGALKVFERAGMFDWDRDYWECWVCCTSALDGAAG